MTRQSSKMLHRARPPVTPGQGLTRRGPETRCGRAERVPATSASKAQRSAAIIEMLNAEIAGTLLACFVMDCCIRLAEQRRRIQPCEDVITRLTAARQEARRLQHLFDPSDTALVQRILEHYSPRIPAESVASMGP
jgi:hypothetical protein